MKILLIAINARYVHTNLAVRYLRAVLEEQNQPDWEVQIKEFSINEHLENIAAEIYEEKPDIIGFSCYIWNITQTISLVRRLRPVLPKAYFIAGGPEVSFDPQELLAAYPQLDAVVVGEGESSVPALLRIWTAGDLPWEVEGIVWRFRKPLEHRDLTVLIPSGYAGKYQDLGSSILFTNKTSTCLPDLNRLPDPYAWEEVLQGRLVYVETSRGCPFNCQFCISSTFKGIRYLEPERFRLILRRLFSYGAKTIKFVDRTFNARKQHAFQILDVFREEAEKLPKVSGIGDLPRAHCEMAGELLDEEWLEYLRVFPPGLIQLEIGVQSTHQPTLDAVKRPQKFSLWQDKVRFLQKDCNIPVHLDLIAGLPLEGWSEFQKSFNDVFAVRPDNLQLGFLKVLKGSGIWEKSVDYGLLYSPDPPYTVLETRDLTHAEILALTRIEDILEKYYNSQRFKYSLEYILSTLPGAFSFFHAFAEYWQEKGWFRREWNPKALFNNLWEYTDREDFASRGAGFEQEFLREALRFDYYLLERPGQVPVFLQNNDLSPVPGEGQNTKPARQEQERKRLQEGKREEIRNKLCWQNLIPEAKDLDKRQLARATAIEYFALDIPNQLSSAAGTGIKPEGAWYIFFYGGKEKRFYKYY